MRVGCLAIIMKGGNPGPGGPSLMHWLRRQDVPAQLANDHQFPNPNNPTSRGKTPALQPLSNSSTGAYRCSVPPTQPAENRIPRWEESEVCSSGLLFHRLSLNSPSPVALVQRTVALAPYLKQMRDHPAWTCAP